MKLLGWMHRKFRQNSNEPFNKDFAIGNSCNCLLGQPYLEEQQFYPKPSSYGSRPIKPHPHNHKDQSLLRKSFAGLDAVRSIEEEDIFEGQSDAITELFDGLLAIGTLGSSDPAGMDEPATPTFPVSVEHVTEKEAEVTENDLKLINEELEKVLGADANKDDKCNDSSGRTSHVSSITLGGRDSNAVCPLQGYLFGSPIELPETATTMTTAVAKKEHRTSLGELFQRTKMVEEKGDHLSKEEKRDGDQKNNAGGKKTLKKRMLRSCTNVGAAAPVAGTTGSPAATSTATTPDSVSAETKLNKILQIFHRKVHPENSTGTKKGNNIVSSVNNNGTNNISQKVNKNESLKSRNDGERAIPVPLPDEDIVIFPKGPICKQRIRRYKCHANSASFGSDSNGNREHWIKTDADYLVLEL